MDRNALPVSLWRNNNIIDKRGALDVIGRAKYTRSNEKEKHAPLRGIWLFELMQIVGTWYPKVSLNCPSNKNIIQQKNGYE